MPFFPPIPLIRKIHIVRQLRQRGASSESNAMTLEEAGVINPGAFGCITKKLVKDGTLGKTTDGKYYIL